MGLKYQSVKNDTGINVAVFLSENNELENIFELINIEESFK